MPNELETYESNTLAFSVKIWIEERAEGTSKNIWRGRITHIPDNKTRYFSDVLGIIPFILPYLNKLGLKVSWLWWFMSWYEVKGKTNRGKSHTSNRTKGEK